MKISKRAKDKFNYFAACQDTKSLSAVISDINGYSSLECFHAAETFGQTLPCREPELLIRARNGKEWHGLNVTHWAEDYVDRLLFADEIKNNYPEWVQKDIFGRAKQIAMKKLGYIPTFVESGEDFTIIE
jgi:hypothetical protein